jgi:hypothetical protein
MDLYSPWSSKFSAPLTVVLPDDTALTGDRAVRDFFLASSLAKLLPDDPPEKYTVLEHVVMYIKYE